MAAAKSLLPASVDMRQPRAPPAPPGGREPWMTIAPWPLCAFVAVLETSGSQGDCAPAHTACPETGSTVTAESGVQPGGTGRAGVPPSTARCTGDPHAASRCGGPASILTPLCPACSASLPCDPSADQSRAGTGRGEARVERETERERGGSPGMVSSPCGEDGTEGLHLPRRGGSWANYPVD